MMRIFLSGSKTVTALPEKLTALLDSYCQQNCEFLIGDCRGADRLMQEYLSAKGYQNVTVYVSGAHTRHCIAGYPVRQINVPESIAGFEFYRQKDIEMAKDCDAAVMLWDGKTRGTRCNIEDIQRMEKPYEVILTDDLSSSSSRFQIENDTVVRWDGTAKSIIVPKTVKVIGKYAFHCCDFDSIILPDQLTVIENKAFFGCRNLMRVTIPPNVQRIGYRAFAFCRSLREVFIPLSVDMEQAVFECCPDFHLEFYDTVQ